MSATVKGIGNLPDEATEDAVLQGCPRFPGFAR